MEVAVAGQVARLITVPEVAEFLRLNVYTVRRLISRRELQSIRFGRAVRVHPDALTEFIARRAVDGSRATRRKKRAPRALQSHR